MTEITGLCDRSLKGEKSRLASSSSIHLDNHSVNRKVFRRSKSGSSHNRPPMSFDYFTSCIIEIDFNPPKSLCSLPGPLDCCQGALKSNAIYSLGHMPQGKKTNIYGALEIIALQSIELGLLKLNYEAKLHSITSEMFEGTLH